MSVIYLISILALIILTILVKKNDKELDFIKSLIVTIVIFLCYQTGISYICTLINIPINLISLTLINVGIIIVLTLKIFKEKQIQKYKFDSRDLYYIVILVLAIILISYFDFGIPLNIKYLTTDSAIHYISAREFFENESLLLNVENINTANAMMPGAYSNIGILFKIFAPWIGEMSLYKVFIGFDIFTLFLSGMLFFVTVKKYAKTKTTYILAIIVSIIYLLGYPLNNMLFGYFYLGIGVLVINAIIAIMQDFGKEEGLRGWQNIIAIFLLCFELFFSYYLFVPPIYAAIFIYYVLHFHKQEKKWINKKMILYTLITLIIPAICGFCYHVLPGLLSNDQIQVANVIQVEGYIYRNMYSNIILFISFAIYYLIKEKKLQFDIVSVILWILYMSVLYIGIFKLNISTYYFFKTYFVLWQIIIYLFFKGICYICEEKKYGKILTSIYVGLYVILMVISFFTSNVQITKAIFNKNEKITDVMDIYGINKNVLVNVEIDYTREELEILNYLKQNNIHMKDNNTLIIANQRQEYWFFAILEYRFKENLNYATSQQHIDLWNSGQYEYLVYFNRSDYYNKYKEVMDLEGKEVIFENESGAVIKNK